MPRYWPIQWALCLAAWLAASTPVMAQSRWPEESWNPHALPDDLVLSLPCAGAMVFRPVATPMSAGPLSDRPVTIGEPDAETDYSEYLRREFVAGPFKDKSGTPIFYIGKYEVTRDQYAAVAAETCPALPTPGGRLPQAEVSWQDAVAFTTRLSGWLIRNASPELPRVDDATAFVRLPTEVEWEYAARGGAAVSDTEFGGRTFPMPDGLRAYVWYQGSRSAGGRARPVGSLQPNQLGLFDILGNLSEWVLDPYRLNKVGRDHGRVGGLITRGGDFQTSEGQIRSSMRIELPPLRASSGEPLRLSTVGFRPVLGVLVTSSDSRPAQYHEAFDVESRSRNSVADDPSRLLAAMRAEARDPAQIRGLERIDQTIREGARLGKEKDDLAVQAMIGAAASLARQIRFNDSARDVLRLVVKGQENVRDFVQDDRSKRLMERMGTVLQGQVDALPEARRHLLDFYMRLIARAGQLAPPDRIADEGRVVIEEMQGQHIPIMPEAARVVVRHVMLSAQGRTPPPEQAEQEILAMQMPPAVPAQTPAPRPAPASR